MNYSENVEKSKEETIESLKAAVKSFRIVELKECLKLFDARPSSTRKGELQKQVLKIIDGLRALKSKPNRRRRKHGRRSLAISYRKQSVYGESPFFSTVEVLVKLEALRTYCFLSLNISPKNAQLLRKKKSGQNLFTHEIQFQLRTEEENRTWRPMTIRLRINEKDLELRKSPPIVYLTQYCLIGKNVLNNIEVELPDNEQCITLVVSIVRRFSPATLQDLCPVKEESKFKIQNLLKDYLNDTGEYIYNITLICPFGRKVMSDPCRGSLCKHPDVFDLRSFLERMQYFLFWKCPICECPVTYKTLEIDPFCKNYLEQGKVSFTFYKKKSISGVNSKEIIIVE